MVKEIKANLLYLIYDHRYSVTVFWSILLASAAGLFVIAALLSTTNMTLSFEGAVYIFCGISGFLITKETFPYLIKLGTTRGLYTLSVLIFNLILATFMSTLAVLVIRLTRKIYETMSMNNFHILSVLNESIIAVTWYNELWFNTMICFFLLSIGSFMGALFYRLGLVGGFSGMLLFVLLFIFPDSRRIIVDLLISLDNNSLQLNYFAIVVISFLAIVPYWLLLRKASTTPGVVR